MHYGSSRFGAHVEWQKITKHEGKVALFDVTTMRAADIQASSAISAYEKSNRDADATAILKSRGILVVPYLTDDHRMYAYHSPTDQQEQIVSGLFVKPSTIDSAHAVQTCLTMLAATDSSDTQAKIKNLPTQKDDAGSVEMKAMFEKMIAKTRGGIDSSKADLANARLNDASEWYTIVQKTNELSAHEVLAGRAEIAQCILSHLARRKLLSAKELRMGDSYSIPYAGRVLVDHTGVSISDGEGKVRYVHTYVTRHKPNGSVESLDPRSPIDTNALCEMREATRMIDSAYEAPKGPPIVFCIRPTSSDGRCTLFAEREGDDTKGAVSCIYVAPYSDKVYDKPGQVSIDELRPVSAQHITSYISGAVTTANDLGIPGTTGVNAFASRVRLFLLLMRFHIFAPGLRGEFSMQTPTGQCSVSISDQDAKGNMITIHDHDQQKNITTTRVKLTGSDRSMAQLTEANESEASRRH
jgi:hypothetical protein